jgi:hypothetical protein
VPSSQWLECFAGDSADNVDEAFFDRAEKATHNTMKIRDVVSLMMPRIVRRSMDTPPILYGPNTRVDRVAQTGVAGQAFGRNAEDYLVSKIEKITLQEGTTAMGIGDAIRGSCEESFSGFLEFTSTRLRVLTNMAAALLLISGSLYASEPGSESLSSAVSRDDTTVVKERTLEAVEGRVKAQESVNALSTDIQDLKKSVIALNKNLRVLEEDLLFPSNTQINVFLSLDVGKYFTLESVKLELDGKVVTSHIYSDKELVALAKSGIHKLHMANLSVGKHSLSAFFTGIGPNGREYKRGTTLKINKESGPKYVELRITDSTMKLQPDFSVKVW